MLVLISFTSVPLENTPQSISAITIPSLNITPIMSEEAYPRGLTQPHKQRSNFITGLDEALGAGACIFDINNDNYMDIFIVPSSGHSRLFGRKSWWAKNYSNPIYTNDSTGYFTASATEEDLSSIWGMGCASGDLNNDGWTDIVLSHRTGVMLLINEKGNLKQKALWKTDSGWPTSITLEDIDANGTLDIYVSNYLTYTKLAKTFEALSGYANNNSRAYDPSLYLGQANKLFINNGDLTFTEKAREFNLDNSDGRTLSSTFININNDHYPDLIINNDSGSPSQILLNHAGKRFAPYNPNMEISLNTRNTVHIESNSKKQTYILGGEYKHIPIISDSATLADISRQVLKNPNEHLGDNNFGSTRIDINNDGQLDIVFANGFSIPDPDSPSNTQGLPNTALMGSRQGHYERYVFREGASLSSRSVARIDIDNDGDHDLLVTNNNGPIQLWINNGNTQNWVGLTSISDVTSTTIKTNIRTFHRDKAVSSFLSSSDPRVSIQLQENEIVSNIEVNFSDGTQKNYTNPKHNQYLNTPLSPPDSTGTLNAKTAAPKRTALHHPSRNFNALSKTEKIDQLTEISRSKNRKRLDVINTALKDKKLNVRIASIKALQAIEAEVGVHWLIDRLHETKETEEICAITDAFHHYFSEEEACTQNKHLAIPALTKIAISHDNEKVQLCALQALSMTRATRAALAAEAILLTMPSEEIRNAANAVLRNVRRGRSPNYIKK